MTAGSPGAARPPALSPEAAASLAKANRLVELGSRPPFRTYVADLWRRRSFLWTLSQAEADEKNSQDRLGVLWTVLNPLLLVCSYYLIFGVLFGTKRNVPNFIGYLSIGVVVFGFTSSAMTKGTRSIINNTGLVRALRFPRALLPLSATLTDLITLLPALGVLLVLMVVTGEPITWHWLLLPLALAIQGLILAGLVLMGARLLNISRDLGNLIPVAIRLLRYVSGVFFDIAQRMDNHPTGAHIMQLQPFALPIDLVRQCLMESQPINWHHWLVGIAWAVGLFGAGVWIFWWDEAKYGRG